MSELPPAARDLVAANLQFFVGANPALAKRLKALSNTLTKPVIEGDAVIDIDVGGARLYDCPGRDFAAEQVATFKAEPARILVRRPDASTLNDPCSVALIEGIEDRLQADHLTLMNAPPVNRSGMLLVLGIGLGNHLKSLIDWAGPRHVVLVEPIDEFLRHSLAVIDWAELDQRCRAQDASCDIIVCDDADQILVQIDRLIDSFGETMIDGSYIYLHYMTPVTQAVASKAKEYVGIKMILKGYFSDECLMIENTSANAAAHTFRLIEGGVCPPLDAPAFLVGAGPSLDGSIAEIKRESGNAVIFTAGSSLQALLHAGIVPDYHVEKENLPMTVERLRHILARNAERFPDGKFTGVRLIASTTVDPGVLELFDEKYLFLRTALSSTAMFGASHQAVEATSPYSANAALTLAAILGFREIYLFGCDCGTRDASRHHSAETVYYTNDGAHAATTIAFEERHKGNFGGEVLTNAYFNWSRCVYEQIIAAVGLTARNCSDGVAIDGAEALRPEDLSLGGQGFNRDAIHTQVAARSVWYPAGGLLAEQDIPGAIAAWRDMTKAIRRELVALKADSVDAHDWYRGLSKVLSDNTAHDHGTGIVLAGTARTLPSFASYYLNRIADPDDAAALFAWFQETCTAVIESQLAEGSALLDTVAARAGIAKEAMRGTG